MTDTTKPIEVRGWAWLTRIVESTCDEAPEDIAYSADQMVDAFMAGSALRNASEPADAGGGDLTDEQWQQVLTNAPKPNGPLTPITPPTEPARMARLEAERIIAEELRGCVQDPEGLAEQITNALKEKTDDR